MELEQLNHHPLLKDDAIAQLSDQLMALSTRLQEIEEDRSWRDVYFLVYRKLPYQTWCEYDVTKYTRDFQRFQC